MITTRSLLWDAVTASWIELKRQWPSSRRLNAIRRCAAALLIFFGFFDGRTRTPFFRALRTSFFSFLKELLPWQTTRVVPFCFLSRALKSLRTFGTLPPTLTPFTFSGAGLGQYEARSM